MVRWKLAATILLLSIGGANPAQSLSCPMGPYIVFFDAGIAYIDLDQREILDNANRAMRSCFYARTLMAGHTDTSEDASLGDKRLNAVRAYFVARGVPYEDITLENFRATQPRIPTGAGVPEPQNRRVEISFGPWSTTEPKP